MTDHLDSSDPEQTPDADERGVDGEGRSRLGRPRLDVDDLLLELLVVGNQKEAAEVADVSPRHVSRRMADPMFRNRLRERRNGYAEAMRAEHLQLTSAVFDALQDVVSNPDEPKRAEVALALYRPMARALEVDDQEDRIGRLEQAIELDEAPRIGGPREWPRENS